jgi:hypothetical protein
MNSGGDYVDFSPMCTDTRCQEVTNEPQCQLSCIKLIKLLAVIGRQHVRQIQLYKTGRTRSFFMPAGAEQ